MSIEGRDSTFIMLKSKQGAVRYDPRLFCWGTMFEIC